MDTLKQLPPILGCKRSAHARVPRPTLLWPREYCCRKCPTAEIAFLCIEPTTMQRHITLTRCGEDFIEYEDHQQSLNTMDSTCKVIGWGGEIGAERSDIIQFSAHFLAASKAHEFLTPNFITKATLVHLFARRPRLQNFRTCPNNGNHLSPNFDFKGKSSS